MIVVAAMNMTALLARAREASLLSATRGLRNRRGWLLERERTKKYTRIEKLMNLAKSKKKKNLDEGF